MLFIGVGDFCQLFSCTVVIRSVNFQFCKFRESFWTTDNVALVNVRSKVSAQMFDEIVALAVRLSAVIALIRFVAGVRQFVSLEMTDRDEFHCALIASELFLWENRKFNLRSVSSVSFTYIAGVNFLVNLERLLLGKLCWTSVASERLLGCVNDEMRV